MIRFAAHFIMVGMAILPSGCISTLMNLTAPPDYSASLEFPGNASLPQTCEPFGGIARDAYFWGRFGEDVRQEIDQKGPLLGAAMVGAETAILVVDTPFSFLGDLVTLPVAQARQKGAPWATWWGEQVPQNAGYFRYFRNVETVAPANLESQGREEPEANAKR